MKKKNELVEAIIDGLQDKKGRDIVVADLTEITDAVCQYFVICSGGVLIGHKFGAKFKSKAEFCGGLVLIIIGLKLLIEGLIA